MKRLVVMLVMVGMTLGAFAATGDTTARDREAIELKVLDNKKVRLLYRDMPEGPLMVKVYNKKSEVVPMFRDRISAAAPFRKDYDFSKLEAGKYKIALKDQKGEVYERVVDLEEPLKNAEGIYTRVDEVGFKKYKLLVNAVEPSDMLVSIYDKGELVYQEKVPHTQGFHKVYALDNTRRWTNVEFKVSSEASGFDKLMSVAVHR